MAINKKLIHFKYFSDFNSKKLSANETNTQYTVGVNGSVQNGNPEILYQSICYIKDTKQQWTHGQLYSGNVDLSSLENVVRVDENGEINRTKLGLNGECLNGNGNTVSYSYGNQENQLAFSHIWNTPDGYNLAGVVMDEYVDLASIRTRDGQNIDSTTDASYATLSLSSGEGYFGSYKISDEGVYPGMISCIDGMITSQAIDMDSQGNARMTSGIRNRFDTVAIESVRYGSTVVGTTLKVTPDGVFINDNPIVPESKKMRHVTYQELKQLRDLSLLVPGQYYRITDYVTTTSQWKTTSAGHQFDVVVLALSEKTLSEEAFAVLHEGDEYFAQCNLSAWKLWYSLDNDITRFAWAFPKVIKVDCEMDATSYLYVRYPKCDTPTQYAWAYISGSEGRDAYDKFEWSIEDTDLIYTTTEEVTLGMALVMELTDVTVADINDCGKGVIYRMIDEFGNDCPYDFKNILFANALYNQALDMYTFNFLVKDALGVYSNFDASIKYPGNVVYQESSTKYFKCNNICANNKIEYNISSWTQGSSNKITYYKPLLYMNLFVYDAATINSSIGPVDMYWVDNYINGTNNTFVVYRGNGASDKQISGNRLHNCHKVSNVQDNSYTSGSLPTAQIIKNCVLYNINSPIAEGLYAAPVAVTYVLASNVSNSLIVEGSIFADNVYQSNT